MKRDNNVETDDYEQIIILFVHFLNPGSSSSTLPYAEIGTSLQQLPFWSIVVGEEGGRMFV